MLAVNSVFKRFGGITAVDSCSMEVETGAITGLIGPNGSGKTTLFNLITGVYQPDKGDINYRSRSLVGLQPSQICHLGISRTFQITRLFWELTVLENMIVPIRQVGLRTLFSPDVQSHEEARAMKLLDFVGLAHLKDEKAKRLSFGQQKLLEFAAILMADPELILLDEPTGGVNPVMIQHITGLIRQLNGGGITFLIVEHNIGVVMNLCDHVVVLDHGRKIAEGPPASVQNDPLVLEAYLGD